jgi:hypothetical protein
METRFAAKIRPIILFPDHISLEKWTKYTLF